MAVKPWYKVVTPREDLREGKPLDTSNSPSILIKCVKGMRPQLPKAGTVLRAHLAYQNLACLASEVIRRFSGERTETDAIFNLATQFGGGKTHALTLLYHLGKLRARRKYVGGSAALLSRAGDGNECRWPRPPSSAAQNRLLSQAEAEGTARLSQNAMGRNRMAAWWATRICLRSRTRGANNRTIG